MPSRIARSTSSLVIAPRAAIAGPSSTGVRERNIRRTGRNRSWRVMGRSRRGGFDRPGSRKRRVDDDVGRDPERGLVSITLAVEAGMALEGAADVVLGIDDGPV